MKEAIVSVAEAAEHFKDFVAKARLESVSFIMVENGAPVARLIPEPLKVCTGKELAAAMDLLDSKDCDFAGWQNDLKTSREILLTPKDKWG